MTQLTERLLNILPAWRKLSGPNQLTSWQQFVSDVQEHINPLVSQDHLRTLTMQLHSMGEVRVWSLTNQSTCKTVDQKFVKENLLKVKYHTQIQ